MDVSGRTRFCLAFTLERLGRGDAERTEYLLIEP